MIDPHQSLPLLLQSHQRKSIAPGKALHVMSAIIAFIQDPMFWCATLAAFMVLEILVVPGITLILGLVVITVVFFTSFTYDGPNTNLLLAALWGMTTPAFAIATRLTLHNRGRLNQLHRKEKPCEKKKTNTSSAP